MKSQKRGFGQKVVDGAFGAMSQRLAASNNPSLLLLHYDLSRLSVANVVIVPKHFFVQEIIERRKPLRETARRGGWVGCNILLNRIPAAGKIYLVKDGQPRPKELVLTEWKRTSFLRHESGAARGWLIETMKCVEEIGRNEFSLEEVYQFEPRLCHALPQ